MACRMVNGLQAAVGSGEHRQLSLFPTWDSSVIDQGKRRLCQGDAMQALVGRSDLGWEGPRRPSSLTASILSKWDDHFDGLQLALRRVIH